MGLEALVRRIFYEWFYLSGRPRWDTGITPPELVHLVEAEHLPPGRALDIGCGTGTNVIYLARHGFDVTGLDFVPRAIQQAQAKARAASVQAELFVADVLAPRSLPPVDFVLDIGCFHNFDAMARPRYVANLAQWTRSGGHYLVYAFFPRVMGARRFGISPQEMTACLSPQFRLIHSSVDPQRADQDSAWYYWERS
ncbi:MAG: methyltransferase domain-containing protein [Anaerolineae bacterium]